MKKPRLRLISGLVLALIISPIRLSHSQERLSIQNLIPVEASPEIWKTFSSTEGRFSVDLPGMPQVNTESIDSPASKLVLTKCILQTASTYSVIYSDYPNKIEGSTAVNRILNDSTKTATAINAKLLSMVEITVDGNPGRLLHERMDDGATTSAKMVIVGRRLYQVAVTLPPPVKTTPEQKSVYESAAMRFIDSFKIIATEEQLGEVDEWLRENGAGTVLSISQNVQVKSYAGKVLNGRALSLPKPPYPPKAREANAQGTVQVKVLIDEKGNVIAAQAMSGNSLLYEVSVEAARASRFSPTKIDGKPIKVTGIVQYHFVKQ